MLPATGCLLCSCAAAIANVTMPTKAEFQITHKNNGGGSCELFSFNCLYIVSPFASPVFSSCNVIARVNRKERHREFGLIYEHRTGVVGRVGQVFPVPNVPVMSVWWTRYH